VDVACDVVSRLIRRFSNSCDLPFIDIYPIIVSASLLQKMRIEKQRQALNKKAGNRPQKSGSPAQQQMFEVLLGMRMNCTQRYFLWTDRGFPIQTREQSVGVGFGSSRLVSCRGTICWLLTRCIPQSRTEEHDLRGSKSGDLPSPSSYLHEYDKTTQIIVKPVSFAPGREKCPTAADKLV
jgi:hypothetical protein